MPLTPVEQKRWQGMYDALARRVNDLEEKQEQLVDTQADIQLLIRHRSLEEGEL